MTYSYLIGQAQGQTRSPQGEIMNTTATTEYGNFRNFEPAADTMMDCIGAALGEYAADYDTDAIAVDLRAAINTALPEGVSLHGDVLYGPYDQRDQEIDYRGIWESIDFWGIAEKHQTAE